MTELDLEKFKLVNGEDIYKIKDSGAVRIAQGAENANKYMVTDAQGNVIPKIIPPVTVKKLYGIRIFKGKEATSGHGVLEMYSSDVADNVSTIASRLALMQQYMRHVIVSQDGEGDPVSKPLDETNLNKYADGTDADLTGLHGEVMLEIDTLYWKSYDCGDYWDIKFGTWAFDDNLASAHKFNGTYRKKVWIGMFNGYAANDTDRLHSISTSEVPTNSKNEEWFYNRAHSAGETYRITNSMDRNLLILLHLFVYGDKNIQLIAKGYNKSGATAADLGACNMDFDPTKAWTNGTTENTEHCCTTLGIMNFYGKITNFDSETIYEEGKMKFATDAADHANITTMTAYSDAPATWKEVTGLVYFGSAYEWHYITEILGDTFMPFRPSAANASIGSQNKYYCDYVSTQAGLRCCFSGGVVSDASGVCGLFAVVLAASVAYSVWHVGARLAITSKD